MPKKTEVWECEDGEIFDTEEEAREHEVQEELKKVARISEDELNTIVYVLEDEEQVKLLSEYMSARKAVQSMREQQNERPEEIKKVLE